MLFLSFAGGRARRMPRAILGTLLAVGVACGLGASDVAGRYNALNHQMMCTCGCAEILGECNHLGCPNAPGMLKTLQTDLTSGMSDHAILVAFEREYGATSLASPLLTRFNQTAWVVPPAVLILGLLGALLLLRRWRNSNSSTAAHAGVPLLPLTPQQAEARASTLARIRRETDDV